MTVTVDTHWNFATVWEKLADFQPERPAQQRLGQLETWGEFDSAADGIAAWLLTLGIDRQARFAQYLRNKPDYAMNRAPNGKLDYPRLRALAENLVAKSAAQISLAKERK